MPLLLHSRGPSPFGRKVRFAAELLGIALDVVEPDEETLRSRNPLAKVPTLVLEDGRALFDSRVVLEFLDHAAGGGRIIPAEPEARYEALRQAALADGVLEAALLVVYEARYRPDREPHEPWLAFQRGKIARALAAAEAAPPAVRGPTVGAIGLACALEYLDFREPAPWRGDRPGLVAWLAEFNAAHPSFAATRPGGAPPLQGRAKGNSASGR